ncbi:MAG: hypothetical protein MJ101_06250 [Clostridia bacterium]|nr:hypothetical protein [Clostridia bacterium]
MLPSLIIFGVTCLAMIAGILFLPKLRIGRITIDTYWPITVIGAALMVMFGNTGLSDVATALTADTSVNPIKILVLFISMTFISIFLDSTGFFEYLAYVVLRRARSSGLRLFIYLYMIVSVLTVFTSNDIIILSFTPFICYFAKSAKIDPMPYLMAEFVAANTWSMALVIGNPTNIYLATAFGIDFISYLRVMILPTLAAGLVAPALLIALMRNRLAHGMNGVCTPVVIKDKPMMYVALAHLAVCTVALACGSYVGLEMWLVALACALSLITVSLIIYAVRRQRASDVGHSLARVPWQLIPFVLSMFTMIVVLSDSGVTLYASSLLSGMPGVAGYGVSSFLAANVINNIPMSVLYSSIIGNADAVSLLPDVYAAIIGSNIGAYLTPIGALAGIMFSSLLASQGMKFGYRDFLKMGVTIAVPTICTALLVLSIEL